MDDGAARPGEQRRHHEADALAGARGCEAQHMLGSIVAQIVPLEPAEHDAVGGQQPGATHLILVGPPRRAIGRDVARLARPPHRHPDRDADRGEPAGAGDQRPLVEDARRVGVVPVPPEEEGRRRIDRHAPDHIHRRAELRLKPQTPRHPLRRSPHRGEHDEEDDDQLTPEDLGGGHGPRRFAREASVARPPPRERRIRLAQRENGGRALCHPSSKALNPDS